MRKPDVGEMNSLIFYKNMEIWHSWTVDKWVFCKKEGYLMEEAGVQR